MSSVIHEPEVECVASTLALASTDLLHGAGLCPRGGK